MTFQSCLRQLLPALLLVGFAGQPSQANAPEVRPVVAQHNLGERVWQLVDSQFAGHFDRDQWGQWRRHLTTGAGSSRATLNTVLTVLNDPYTRLLSPEEFRQFSLTASGTDIGVGLRFDPASQPPLVARVIPNSPAARAGVRSGDRLLAIDGRPAVGLAPDSLSLRLRGTEGTRVTLTLTRTGRTLKLRLLRARFRIPAVLATLLSTSTGGSNIGYLRLLEFTDRSPAEVAAAIDWLEAGGSTGLLLDLRGNPGGRVESAAEIAQMFLGEGPIATVTTRSGTELLLAHGVARTSLPLVVLIDEHTASAAELLAAALGDNRRAALVGSTTYGKAAIQRYFPLPDGSALCLTIGYYRTPRSTEIHYRGVVPDIVIPDAPTDKGPDPQYRAAARLLEAEISPR